ncbi:MAG: T9SS type A sorting domain-containing protein [Flavobacteriales bacterium]|nr:T9SS type A sorting domain-containing protein [Flavobacteriales bacterium]
MKTYFTLALLLVQIQGFSQCVVNTAINTFQSSFAGGVTMEPNQYFDGNFTVYFPYGGLAPSVPFGSIAIEQVGVMDVTGMPDGMEYEFYLDNGDMVDTTGMALPFNYAAGQGVSAVHLVPQQPGYSRWCIRIYGTPTTITSGTNTITVRFFLSQLPPAPLSTPFDYTIEYAVSENLFTPEICFVSTELGTGVNQVVWERLTSNFTDSFRIYSSLVTSPQQIQLLGAVAYQDLTVFVDPSPSSSAATNYYLSMVNNDGDESNRSAKHTTIHLRVDTFTNTEGQQMGLSWNNYFPQPGLEQDYLVYAGSSPSQLTLQVAIPAGFTNWILPFATSLTYYAIGTTLDAYCTPSKTSSGEDVFSNTVSNAIFLGIEDREQILFSAYPNPASSHITIELPEDLKRGTIELFNAQAQLVMQYSTTNQNATIDISSLDQGLYFIHLTDGEKQGWEKFVRQ